jgi:hypothetical protein
VSTTSVTTRWRTIVGTVDEALDIARVQAHQVDASTGAQISINPVGRDPETGEYQWEVMVSGVPTPAPEA